MPVAPAFKPMLCQAGILPDRDDGWVAELKWDGARAVTTVDDRGVCVRARSGQDITSAYPELAGFGELVGGRQVVLDGELVCLDEQGVPSFARLQTRLGRRDVRPQVAAGCPVTLVCFDVLWLDGENLCARPWEDRRQALEELSITGGPVIVPPVQRHDLAAFFDVVRQRQLEGIVLKQPSSRYQPGQRSGSWRKVKALDEAVFVVCAVEGGKGSRQGRLGCLHLAEHGPAGVLRYAGSVGSGFSEADLQQFATLLGALARADSPVEGWVPPPDVICVTPRVTVRVRHLGRTASGLLRQPVYASLAGS